MSRFAKLLRKSKQSDVYLSSVNKTTAWILCHPTSTPVEKLAHRFATLNWLSDFNFQLSESKYSS